MEEAVKLRRYLASLVVYSKVLSVSDGRDNWHPTTSVQVFVEQANNPVLYDIENHWLLKYTTGLTVRAWENRSKVLTQNRTPFLLFNDSSGFSNAIWHMYSYLEYSKL